MQGDSTYDNLIWGEVWDTANKKADGKNWAITQIVIQLAIDIGISESSIWRRINEEESTWRKSTRKKLLKYIGHNSIEGFVQSNEVISVHSAKENSKLVRHENVVILSNAEEMDKQYTKIENIVSGSHTKIDSKKTGSFKAKNIESGKNTEMVLKHNGVVDIDGVNSKDDTIILSESL